MLLRVGSVAMRLTIEIHPDQPPFGRALSPGEQRCPVFPCKPGGSASARINLIRNVPIWLQRHESKQSACFISGTYLWFEISRPSCTKNHSPLSTVAAYLLPSFSPGNCLVGELTNSWNLSHPLRFISPESNVTLVIVWLCQRDSRQQSVNNGKLSAAQMLS